MSTLPKQALASQSTLSALRQRLKQPGTWLAIFGALALLGLADSYRDPPDQVTGFLYIRAVRTYQAIGRPILRGHIQCRYNPTCSEYSIEAVRTHGIRHGLVLTWKRVSSCQDSVPLGTNDPVPPLGE